MSKIGLRSRLYILSGSRAYAGGLSERGCRVAISGWCSLLLRVVEQGCRDGWEGRLGG